MHSHERNIPGEGPPSPIVGENQTAGLIQTSTFDDTVRHERAHQAVKFDPGISMRAGKRSLGQIPECSHPSRGQQVKKALFSKLLCQQEPLQNSLMEERPETSALESLCPLTRQGVDEAAPEKPSQLQSFGCRSASLDLRYASGNMHPARNDSTNL